ncbi:MAG TPA: sugar phosphate isomerase/epimerase family protein [Urbifossiella sp.]|jgi:sugar phosphate isomerase/epimerase|nr:sugar phosphate isomerase/epimerase family protein [Urbifossiella sp.]
MKSAVTVSLVPEARGGPFVFWDDLPAACRTARAFGFDAIEMFPPGPDAVDTAELKALLDDTGLAVAAVGTGAGWVKHKLTLTAADQDTHAKAMAFVEGMIDFAAVFDAPVIIGSMQGRADAAAREATMGYLAEALLNLGLHAKRYGLPLLYEPLNRYETNLVNRLDDGVKLVAGLAAANVKLLADLYHMNIEEADLPAALRAAGPHVGHVHFADSNRRAAGMGHTDFTPVVAALREIGYAGYLSAEVLPLPDPAAAARQTIESFRRFTSER